jgi:hypothetical protein
MPENQTPKHRKLNRLEISVAEILRQNYPGDPKWDEGMVWMDICEDFDKMFGVDPLFDSGEFWERCFGDDWTRTQAQDSRLNAAITQASALDTAREDTVEVDYTAS